jgi:hypothetical protein
MDDARIVDHVIEILKSVDRPLPAREIVRLLAARGIQIGRPALSQILWSADRNYRRSEMQVDKKNFQWTLLEEQPYSPTGPVAADLPRSEILAFWSLLDFNFFGVQRKNSNTWFFFLEKQGDCYRIVGPMGNILSEEHSVCSEPEECEPIVFTSEQIIVANQEWLKIKHSEFLSRNRQLFELIRDTEHFYKDAYVGPPAARVNDFIPLDALIVIAPIVRLLDHEVKFGLAGVFSPVYLVIDVAGLGLEEDRRYGVFKLCVYDLIKKRYIVEDENEGHLSLKMQYRDGKVYLCGAKDSLLLA